MDDLEKAKSELIQSLTDGLDSQTVDGTSFKEMDPEKRKRVIDALEGDEAIQDGPFGLLSIERFRSPHPNQ